VLFDEIEKAHPDVFNTLLQVLEEGHLTDSTGRKVDFRNTVVMMTSNVGARRIGKNTTLGFYRDEEGENYERMKDRVIEEAKKVFNPEFMNRIDEIVVFHRLSKLELMQIVEIQVQEMVDRVAEQGVRLVLSDDAKDFLVRVGSNEEYGARPLRRAVQQYLEDPLAELLLKGEMESSTVITMRPSDIGDRLVFDTEAAIAEGVAP